MGLKIRLKEEKKIIKIDEEERISRRKTCFTTEIQSEFSILVSNQSMATRLAHQTDHTYKKKKRVQLTKQPIKFIFKPFSNQKLQNSSNCSCKCLFKQKKKVISNYRRLT